MIIEATKKEKGTQLASHNQALIWLKNLKRKKHVLF